MGINNILEVPKMAISSLNGYWFRIFGGEFTGLDEQRDYLSAVELDNALWLPLHLTMSNVTAFRYVVRQLFGSWIINPAVQYQIVYNAGYHSDTENNKFNGLTCYRLCTSMMPDKALYELLCLMDPNTPQMLKLNPVGLIVMRGVF